MELKNTGSEKQLKLLQVGFIFLLLAWILSTAWLATRSQELPSVIRVERLEVVEPDGLPALVISNSQRPTVATLNGQVVMEGQEVDRLGLPSIIFFDGKGDEVGGMLFGVQESENGYSATRHLSLDGYKQDQTIVLAHYQDSDGSRSGLTISDRPDHSILEAQIKLGLDPGATRAEIASAIGNLPPETREEIYRELFGSTRASFGTDESGNASLELRDGAGRLRIVIQAPFEGEPTIQMYDSQGDTITTFP